MEKELKTSTISLIGKYKEEIALSDPITETNAKEVTLKLLQFFTELEASLSLDLDDGIETNRQLLDDVSNAVDDFNLEKGDRIDFKSINEVLFG